ncbi:MAG TPA: hypothetical protein VK348_10855 [Planctomycetota bacterium]|nr:hypothetical protein [Planctomycetota bacterium]
MVAIPQSFARLAQEIDGWLDLRCPEKALARLGAMLEDPAARPAALVFRVRALVNMTQYATALGDLAELRGSDHDPEWLDLTEAWCRKRSDDLPGAVRCMEQLVARNQRSAIGHFNLGCYLALAGDKQRALDEVTMACGLDVDLRDFAGDEPDLDSLHDDPRFRALLTGVDADETRRPPDDAAPA